MMLTYSVFLTIILLIQVGIAVAAYVYEDDFKAGLNKEMSKNIVKYDEKPEIKQAWDTMQSNLKCCGYDDYKNWQNTRTNPPESCCKRRAEGCADGVFSETEEQAMQKIHVQGCVNKAFAQLRLKYVIIAAAVIAGIEFIGILFSCCLAARFRRKNYV